MHISEGVLSLPVMAGGYTLTAAGVGIGLKKMKDKEIVRTAIFSSAFFVASLIHIPFGPSSVHLVLNGLLGLLLGWPCFCAIFVALLVQAVLFQYGGITTLGVNVFNMAAPAMLVYYLLRPLLLRGSRGVSVIGFLAGFLSVLFSALLLSAALVWSGEQFLSSAKVIFISNSPVMIADGIITGLVLVFINKVKPEIIWE